MAAVLEVQNIEKKFQDREVLKSLNLELQAGEFLCLLGPSGCGKSTLLRIMAGLEAPTQGRILVQDPRFAFVFQESQLLVWRTALENTRLPLELEKKLSPEQQNQKALAALQKVRLSEVAGMFPHELSGGMKMRVSIARALSSSPKILFMDEPFSALDEITRFDLQKQLRDLCEQEKLSVVFVTHSTYEAAFLADRIVMMGPQAGSFVMEQKITYSQARNDELRRSPAYQDNIEKISQQMRRSFS